MWITQGRTMNTKVSRFHAAALIATVALLLHMGTALSAEPPAQGHPVLSKEQREKMATIHEQMAACLRSDKPVADCHREAMKSCQEMMGKEGCPMMGAMHEHMMQQSSKTDEHK
jgi:hypothetical protein